MAMRFMTIGHSKELIAMFKNAEKGTYHCTQCKKETQAKFNDCFLAYYANDRVCPDCLTKIAKTAQEQKVIDKDKAFVAFADKSKAMIQSAISLAGVPVLFHDADMSDLGHASSKAFDVKESYFIQGAVGVGKSHMAAAMLRQYVEALVPQYDEQKREFCFHDFNSLRPRYIEAPELLLEIRDSYSGKSTMSEKEIVDYYTMTPFLVLDDLGSEKASEFSTLMIYLIINRRCTSGKTTIITSNLDLAEIKERLSDRISSRIKGMCREITVDGNDKRCEKKQGHGHN